MGGISFTIYQPGNDLSATLAEAVARDRDEPFLADEGCVSIAQKRVATFADDQLRTRSEAEVRAAELIEELTDELVSFTRGPLTERIGDFYSEKCGALKVADERGKHVGFLLFGYANT